MSSTLLRTVHAREKQALVEEGALAVVLPYAAVRDLETVRSTPSALRESHPCVWRPLAGVHLQSARVQYCPTLGYRFLWCHVDNSSYRRHYLRFLQREHGWNGRSIPSEWHVDHIFNRARAKKLELGWVRMMLLPGPVNTSHGAGYEKQRTRSRILGRPGRSRKLDEITLLKVAGLRSPRQRTPLTLDIEAHARWIADRHGLATGSVISNIHDLLAI
nr:hypothetical protein [Microbacterium testaceum]